MKDKKLIEIKAAVYEMGLLFNQMPNDEKISAYAKALENYEPRQIVFAFRQVIKSGSAFFPSLAEILKHLQPAKELVQDQAPAIATEIMQLLRWYGPHDEANMIKNASGEAKLVFQALGFTGDIRNSENPDTVRAQLERLARSVLSRKTANDKNAALEKIGIDTGKVLKLQKPEFKTVDYSGFLPGDPA
jgi:hypothetical protein